MSGGRPARSARSTGSTACSTDSPARRYCVRWPEPYDRPAATTTRWKRVALPDGWLDGPDEDIRLSAAAEALVSGG